MKKAVLSAVIFTVFVQAYGQQYSKGSNTAPIRLSEIADAYNQTLTTAGDEKNKDGMLVSEGKDYHFQRWYWYWKQHTDEKGFMVSPVKSWMEANKYQTAQAKGTAGNNSN